MMKIKTFAYIIIAALMCSACDEFLDITPTGKVIAKTGDEYRALLTYEYKYFVKDRYMTVVRTDEVLMDKKQSSSTDLDAYLDLWRWVDDAPSPTTTYFSWRTYFHSIYIANYIIEQNATVRQTAKKFGISKSTVHKDVTERLEEIDPSLAKRARIVLDVNKSERHIRGGMATKEKYLQQHT